MNDLLFLRIGIGLPANTLFSPNKFPVNQNILYYTKTIDLNKNICYYAFIGAPNATNSSILP